MISLFAIIVTWNGEDYIVKCLQSLLNSSIPMQIVVIDNESSDRTIELVRTICPDAIIFSLTRNLGFGRANNIGIKYAYDQGAEHIMLINQDAYVDPLTPQALVRLQKENPESAIISPLHLNVTGDSLDELFSRHIGKDSGIGKLLGDLLLRREAADTYHIDFINAAIWLLSRECITRVGLFNPAFYHYGEDREYADRVRYHGFYISLAPAYYAYHERAQSPQSEDSVVTRYRYMVNSSVSYRISRKRPRLWFNIASAISCIALSAPPQDISFVQTIWIKLHLFCKLLSSLPSALRYRKRAYQNARCFFEDAVNDKELYVM